MVESKVPLWTSTASCAVRMTRGPSWIGGTTSLGAGTGWATPCPVVSVDNPPPATALDGAPFTAGGRKPAPPELVEDEAAPPQATARAANAASSRSRAPVLLLMPEMTRAASAG